ncbi:MAG: uridine phosphorylase, partial [Clostridiales bacterium]|nr:uridine phosphorylase [Clostridiales bacterium]
GKVFLPTACVRDESTSATYVRKSYPAVADFDLLACMEQGAKAAGRDVVKGINCTMDGFYSQMKDSRYSRECGRVPADTFEELKRLRVLGADMESACMLTLGGLLGVRTCSVTMTTVLENLKEVLQGEARKQAEADLCLAALEGIVLFHREQG